MSTSIERPLLRSLVVAALTLVAVVAAALSPPSADARDRDGDRTVTESRPDVEDGSAKPTPLPTPSVGPAWEKPILFALGDSYASGEGVPPFVLANADERFDVMEAAGFSRLTGQLQISTQSDSDASSGQRHCHRSDRAAARVISDNLVGPAMTFKRINFVACSGATTAALGTPQVFEAGQPPIQPAQLDIFDAEPDTTAPRVITVSIGGNDLGFESILRYCGKKVFFNCTDASIPANSQFLANNAAKIAAHEALLYATLNEIADANGSTPAVVLLVGGPKLFDESCGGPIFYPVERTYLNGLAVQVDQKSADAVDTLAIEWATTRPHMQIRYVSTISTFEGRGVCSVLDDDPGPDQWIHGYFDEDDPRHYWSFHPNETGQFERAVEIGKKVDAWLNAYYW